MDQVDEVKQKVDIVGVIGAHVSLKKAGRNYKGLCPFHQEKSPSFMVSPELQIFKCFGCGESGDVIAFLQKYEHMDFYEALKSLADRVGITLKPVSPQFGQNDRLYQLNRNATRFYNYVLLMHPAGKKALSYLTQERGLRVDTIKKFELGYSPDKTDVLANYLIKKKKFVPQELVKGGLVYSRGSSLVDRFAGRVTFPIFDHRGNIIAFAGRVLPGAKTEMGKYINSPETPVYHKSRNLYGLNYSKEDIKKDESVVVVEGELDYISCWQAGVRNIVAIKGTAFTTEQISLLSRFTQKLILALDADFAGNTAARKGIAVAQEAGLDITVINLGKFKDPDEFARVNPEGLKKEIDSAIGVWDYLINLIFKGADTATGVGKTHLSREIVPILNSIPDDIVQAHYIEVVAKKLGVPSEAVYDQMDKGRKKSDTVKPTFDKIEKKNRREVLESRLVTLALHINPELLIQEKFKSLLSQRVYLKLVSELENFIKKNTKFNTSSFARGLPRELYEAYSDLMLNDIEGDGGDKEKIEKEIEIVTEEIKEYVLRQKLSELGTTLKKLESEGDSEKVKLLQEKFKKLSQKLSKLEESDDRAIIL